MDDIEKARVCRAIIQIFAEKDLYGGLDILCDLVGWGSFRCEDGFYPARKMKEWLESITPVLPKVEEEKPSEPISPKCRVCGRQCRPNKGLRVAKNACPECGRGFRKRRIKEDV